MVLTRRASEISGAAGALPPRGRRWNKLHWLVKVLRLPRTRRRISHNLTGVAGANLINTPFQRGVAEDKGVEHRFNVFPHAGETVETRILHLG